MGTSILEPDKDLQEVSQALASGVPIRPELRQRLDRQRQEICEEIRQKHGTLNVAVELIREIRESA